MLANLMHALSKLFILTVDGGAAGARPKAHRADGGIEAESESIIIISFF